jgi:dTDP-4-amino-4,6-dideoxygalactose transaminase
MTSIPFIDLQAQRKKLGASLDRAIAAAVEGGQWIMGPQVRALEEQLAQFAGVKHAIACANGTDALLIILRAWDIGPGDAVFVPGFTFAASAEVVALVGATPVFVDVLEDTFNMSPASLEAAIATVKREGRLRPRVVMPVDLFGQAADHRPRKSADAVRHGAGLRRGVRRPADWCDRRCRRHELLSRQAARLLWRWWLQLYR